MWFLVEHLKDKWKFSFTHTIVFYKIFSDSKKILKSEFIFALCLSFHNFEYIIYIRLLIIELVYSLDKMIPEYMTIKSGMLTNDLKLFNKNDEPGILHLQSLFHNLISTY